MKSLLVLLKQWNANNESITKLQHGYIVLAILSLIVAGIIGLINYSLGQSILFFAVVAALVFVANGVVWALLRTFVVSRLDAISKPRKK